MDKRDLSKLKDHADARARLSASAKDNPAAARGLLRAASFHAGGIHALLLRLRVSNENER